MCVNQDGERVEDKNINILHVMANESFADFAETLQREIEDDTGMKFGVLQIGLFSGMVYEERKEVRQTVTQEQVKAILLNAECGIRNSEFNSDSDHSGIMENSAFCIPNSEL